MENIVEAKVKRNIRMPFVLESIALAIIPFEETLALSFGSVLRLINLCTIFVCILEAKRVVIPSGKTNSMIPMLVFFAYVVLSFFWCFNTNYFLDRTFTYGLYIVLMILLFSLKPKEKEKKSMLNGMMIGGVLASLMIILGGNTVNVGERETLVIFGRMVDPNILAYSCVSSLIICLCHLINDKRQKVINVAMLISLLSAIVVCGSRGAFITSAVSIILIVLGIEFKKNKFIKRFFALFFVLATLIFLYFQFIMNSEFGVRFELENLLGQGEMGMANRDKIWEAAFTQFVKRPILGYGNGASMNAIEEVYKFYGTHNSYILLLLEFGVVGFLIALWWQFRVFRMCNANTDKVYKFLFISMLIFIVFVEGFATKVFWGVQVLLLTSGYGVVSEKVNNDCA